MLYASPRDRANGAMSEALFLVGLALFLAQVAAISHLHRSCSRLLLPSFRLSGPTSEGQDIVDSLRQAGLRPTAVAPGTWLVRSMTWVEQGNSAPANLYWGIGVLRTSGSSWQLEGRCGVGLPIAMASALLGLVAPRPTGPIGLVAWLLSWAIVAIFFFAVQTKDARGVFERFQEITARTTKE